MYRAGENILSFTTRGYEKVRLGMVLEETMRFFGYTGATRTFCNFYFDNGTTQVGSIASDGAQTFYLTTSDRELKEDIKPIDSVLSKLELVKVYKYKWKNDTRVNAEDCPETHKNKQAFIENRGIGFIADELNTLFPECVCMKKDEDSVDMVDYSKMIPILTKSIQELNGKVKKLELLNGLIETESMI